MLHFHLHPFHRGFLKYKGHEWQLQQVNQWRSYHQHLMEDYPSFRDRIEVQNNAHTNAVISTNSFIGSIGAVDGTYSVVCKLEEAQPDLDEDGEALDRMYTNYKKCHAYKLVLATAHHTKYILALEIAPGSASDPTVYNTKMFPFLNKNLIKEAALLGDHAFHSVFLVITPYPTIVSTFSHQATTVARERFNHNHAKDRMCSEHGNCQIKAWAIVRGRTDHIMFEDENGFVQAVEVCWGLHNWLLELKDKEASVDM